MSTRSERLHVIYEAYSKAYERRLQDWQEATSKDQAEAIATNLGSLEEAYLRAAKQALDANGAAVEAAFSAAQEAQKATDDAYQDAKAIPEKIRHVTGVVASVGDLLRKAGQAAA
jgi:hypothetical protein